jgi:acyl-CoA dehydrogenase
VTGSMMYPAYPAPSARAVETYAALEAFMQQEVFPAEPLLHEQHVGPDLSQRAPHPVLEELKAKAKERGLWNLFLPHASGFTQLEYAPMAELTGWSLELAPEATNCAAPDTGNMELLHLVGTEEQQARWLQPLLDGEFRSAFAMTEPAVASSDATNIETRIVRALDRSTISCSARSPAPSARMT